MLCKHECHRTKTAGVTKATGVTKTAGVTKATGVTKTAGVTKATGVTRQDLSP